MMVTTHSHPLHNSGLICTKSVKKVFPGSSFVAEHFTTSISEPRKSSPDRLYVDDER